MSRLAAALSCSDATNGMVIGVETDHSEAAAEERLQERSWTAIGRDGPARAVQPVPRRRMARFTLPRGSTMTTWTHTR